MTLPLDLESQLMKLSPEHAAYVLHRIRWLATARSEQVPPLPDEQEEWLARVNEGRDPAKIEGLRARTTTPDIAWTEFGIQSGRGWGKTASGAEWIFQAAWEDPLALPRCVIGPTQNDVRFTCFEGEGSGLLAVIPPACIENYNKTDLMLFLKNGAIIRGFSAEKPDRLRGPNHADAWCFAAGTPILMADGSECSIELIRFGDMVMTRHGKRQVTKAGRSANPAPRVKLSYGATSLTATEDHPILTTRGWVPAGELREGDELWSVYPMAGSFGGRIRTAISCAAASQPKATNYSIAAFTRIISALFQMGITFTIRTMILATTIRTIWKSCLLVNMYGIICSAKNLRRSSVKRFQKVSAAIRNHGRLRLWFAPDVAFLSSVVAIWRRGLFAHLVVLSNGGTTYLWGSRANVLNVVGVTSLRMFISDFAANDAICASNDRRSTERQSRAQNAGPSSNQSATTRSTANAPALFPLVLKSVEKLATFDPVYNLTVAGEHEFIAGGIVVHNCDELAAWGPDGEDVWDMMEFGLRIGARPRILWSSTPKPNSLIRRLTGAAPGRIIVRGRTKDNEANLAKTFLDKIRVHEGTKLGKQELDGELLDPEEGGIIRRSWFRLWPNDKPLPSFQWIIMSLDTAFTERTLDKKGDPDPTACGVWGVFVAEKRSNVMLLDCWEDYLGLPDLARRVRKEMANRYGDDIEDAVIKPLVGSGKPVGAGRKPDILLIEDKGSGISLRQTLAESGIEAYPYNPGRADKVSRLHIVSPLFAQRRVWLPESGKMPGKPRNWCEPLIAQLCSFTGEGSIKHDDHCDQTSQALRLMIDKQLLSLAQPTKEEKEEARYAEADKLAAKEYSNPYAA